MERSFFSQPLAASASASVLLGGLICSTLEMESLLAG